MRQSVIVSTLLLCLAPGASAQDLPKVSVEIPVVRWRSVHHLLYDASQTAGVRWAVPATIHRRAFIGADKPRPLADVIDDLCKQTGLTVQMRGGVLVVHEPNAKLRDVVARVHGKDRRVSLQAIVELGWMRDAGAWPELAKVVTGDDIELALAAAQALRRLEGERPLDWRLYGVASEDPEFPDILGFVSPWQAPLGMAFPDSVKVKDVGRLAASSYLPLREAAARLSPSLGANGTLIVGTLLADPSPLVKAAAEQAILAWEKAATVRKPWIRKSLDGTKFWFQAPPPDLKAAAEELAKAKDHDTIWRLLGRRVVYQGTPEAIKVMIDYGKSGAKWSSMTSRALAEFCGGPDVIAWLSHEAGRFGEYGGHQGWALWGLTALQDGESLANSLRPALESRAFWSAPPEYSAAYGAGIHAQDLILARLDKRGHWVCRALGYIGGPKAAEVLIAHLDHKDPGVAVAAAKALGDTSALAGIKPLIAQLKHPDRLRRHWAVLALGKIGGPEAQAALATIVQEDEKHPDRLVRRAAIEMFVEISSPRTPRGDIRIGKLAVADLDQEDSKLVPEYRPRNPRFDDSFPLNTEVTLKEHKPVTYCSIGETRAAFDWANRLMFRYGGCTPCYSNEMFAFDVGTSTWFPIRAADHFCDLINEVHPNPGCSRGMTYDGINKLVWIGHGIGSSTGPTYQSHNRRNGLSAYDAALDRFLPCVNEPTMANIYGGEPSKAFAFDYDFGLVVGSRSGGRGIGFVDAASRKTFLGKAPPDMPSWDQYRPPAFCYDPVDRKLLCTHPDLGWKLLSYDRKSNTFQVADEPYPGKPSKQIMGGLVYDSLNREMILIGGISKDTGAMPTCRLDRKTGHWIDLDAKNLGAMGVGQDTCVYDPEHNVILELVRGVAYRYRNVPVGTRAFHGGAK